MMNLLFHRVMTIRALAVLLLGTAVASAQTPQTTPATQPRIEPQAEKVLRDLTQYIQNLQTFSFELVSTVKMTSEKTNQEQSNLHTFAVARPDKAAIILQEGQRGVTLVSNGRQAHVYLPELNKYTVKPAPDTIAELIEDNDYILEAAFGGVSFAAGLLTEDPYDRLTREVTAARYVGVEEIDGVQCHHLRFAQQQVDWDLWVRTGDQPLVQRFSPDLTRMLEQARARQPEQLRGTNISVIVNFNQWKTGSEIPDERFAWTPPENAEKVESFLPTEEDHPMLGRLAPDFTGELLDGGQFDFSQVKGEKVIILDFWATWCGPCTVAIPVAQNMAKTYGDQVAFYTVNVNEEPDLVREAMQQRGWEFPVVMDQAGEIAKLYNVDGFPASMVIGKDGRIQAVHTALRPDLRSKLRKELRALIEGKSLLEAKTGAATQPAGQ